MDGALDKLQTNDKYHRRQIKTANWRNYTTDWVKHWIDNLVEQAKRLVILIDARKPGQKALDKDQHGKEADRTVKDLQHCIHMFDPSECPRQIVSFESVCCD